MDRTKYDVELDGQAFSVRTLSKESAPALAPRFNTGRQGETDLTLVKNKSVLNFEGGMLQEEWQDDQMVSVARNCFYDVLSGYLFTSPAKTEASDEPSDNINADAYFTDVQCIFNGELYNAVEYYASGLKNKIRKVSDDSDVTLHADLASSLFPISSMIVYEDYMIISNADSGKFSWYWDGSTMLEMASGGGITWWGKTGDIPYALNFTMELYSVDLSTIGSPVFTSVGVVGEKDISLTLPPLEYQNRLYFAKPEGLFVYDGVKVYKILDQHFTQAVEYRGRLYLSDGRVVYRFNGASFEFLKDFASIGIITGAMRVAKDRLWFAVEVSYDVEDVQGGKFGGTASTGEVGLYYYDEVGFFEYQKMTLVNQVPVGLIADDNIFLATKSDQQFTDAQLWKWTLLNEKATDSVNTQELEVITSTFDGGFPNVKKSLHSVRVTLSESGSYIGDMKYRTRDAEGIWSAWTTLASIDDSDQQEQAVEADVKFYAVQVSFVGGQLDTKPTAIKRISFGYTLHPEQRNRWTVGLVCQGESLTTPQPLKDGTEEVKTAKQLRDVIYQAVSSEAPVWFYDIDYGQLSGALAQAALGNRTIKGGTYGFSTSGYIRIGLEIISYDRLSATQLTLRKRGMFGTTDVAHSVDDVVEQAFRVYATRIINEQYLIGAESSNTDDSEPTRGQESIVNVQLEEL